jgi:hypothetical protein
MKLPTGYTGAWLQLSDRATMVVLRPVWFSALICVGDNCGRAERIASAGGRKDLTLERGSGERKTAVPARQMPLHFAPVLWRLDTVYMDQLTDPTPVS